MFLCKFDDLSKCYDSSFRKKLKRQNKNKHYKKPLNYSMKNLVSPRFIEIALRHGCSPVNLLNTFRTPFPQNTFGWVLLLLKQTIYHFSLDLLSNKIY